MNLTEKVFGIHGERELKMTWPIVTKTESLRPETMATSNEELRDQTRILRERLIEGVTLDDILPEAFTTVCEAAKRTLNMEYFPVQLIGGIVLHQGRIVEMRIGGGKMLVSICPAYLNALKGKGVQIVTVNDYPTKRDTEWMGQVHKFLGMTVGIALNDMISEQCKEAYACDITCVTNNEPGLDYLRDNTSIYKERLVLCDLDYCIIDEVDSVLIDGARVPFIISGQSGKSIKLYEVCDVLARQPERGTVPKKFLKIDAIMGEEIEGTDDFVMDEKDKVVSLTEQDVEKVEGYFHTENLADSKNLEIQHNITLALRANNLMFRDKDHVAKDDEALTTDEFTDRTTPDRRYSDGLHQAIEAKGHVNVYRESCTLAIVTFQNLFNKYTKKAGMTDTAQTEEKELHNIYAMDAIVILTNKSMIRKNLEGVIYKTGKEKYKAVADEVEKVHEKGQPVLAGTIAIEISELPGKMLTKKGTPHKVLDAKFHKLEVETVADAGIHGSVIIATNMAGRGTDIKLDEETKALGGLKIIGTERHESRHIDNQLRGRSGRQGNPGESRFHLSLEDDPLRLFGSDRFMIMFEAMDMPEGEQIEHKMLSNTTEKTQMKIESNNYDIREQLLKFDEVNNEQHKAIYAECRKVPDGDNMRGLVFKMITDIVESVVDISTSDDQTPDKWDSQGLNNFLLLVIPLKPVTPTDEQKKSMKKNKPKYNSKEKAIKLYETEEAEFPEPEQTRETEYVVPLKVTDNRWMVHLDDMDALREGIGLQVYGQRDPVVECKIQGYKIYESMMASIQEETIRILFHTRMEQEVERESAAKMTGMNKDASIPSAPKRRVEQKIYPNDSYPCSSGKKYK